MLLAPTQFSRETLLIVESVKHVSLLFSRGRALKTKTSVQLMKDIHLNLTL